MCFERLAEAEAAAEILRGGGLEEIEALRTSRVTKRATADRLEGLVAEAAKHSDSSASQLRIANLRAALEQIRDNRHHEDCDGLFAEPEGCWGVLAAQTLGHDQDLAARER
jgi:hypothetical protein